MANRKIVLELNKKAMLLLALFVAVGVGSFLFADKDVGANPIKERYDAIQNPAAKSLYFVQSDQLTKSVPEKLIALDEKKIGCFGPSTIMQMSDSSESLGGQCCGALKDIRSYDLQIEALHAFKEAHENGGLIPEDPYDVPVSLAKKLTAYDTAISLTSEQQNIYDTALQNSHHGGPCCCKCWKWYMMSGLGKKLIVDYGWNAEDLAELWDISSSCGHDGDTNMHEHYTSKKEEHAH